MESRVMISLYSQGRMANIPSSMQQVSPLNMENVLATTITSPYC